MPKTSEATEMRHFRAEVLGSVPNGLTHNDVFSSFVSLLGERVEIEAATKRRLAGNMVSIIVTFKSEDLIKARTALSKAKTGITGFSADTFGFREV